VSPPAVRNAGEAKTAHWRQLGDVCLIIALILVVWQSLYWIAGSSAVSAPVTTALAAWKLLGTKAFAEHLGATGYALLISFAFAALGGVPVGLALGFRRFAGDVFEPILTSLYMIPKVTLYPIVLTVFGLGLSAKVAFGVMHGVIPMILITMSAVRAIKPVHIKTARTLRLSAWQVATAILIPSVLPEIVTALRVGFSLTLLGVLVGEMFSSERGLGFLLIKGITTFDVTTSIAITLMIVAFGVSSGALLLAIDRRFHRSTRHA
jgi:NitT/TauT family transport system permease protein